MPTWPDFRHIAQADLDKGLLVDAGQTSEYDRGDFCASCAGFLAVYSIHSAASPSRHW